MVDLVSIIVPVYNVENYIDKCIESLINQSYSKIEIILINDGSKDKSGEKCDIWSEKDDRIKVIHKSNGGVSSARNEGLREANGTYIMFVDSDDYLEKNMVEKLCREIKSSDSDIVYCGYYMDFGDRIYINKLPISNGTYDIEEVFQPLFFGTKNNGNTSMSTSLVLGIFRKQIISDNNILFDTYIRFAEDWLFYAEYIVHCKKISIINEPLYHYVQRSSSVMHEYVKPSELGVKKSIYILNRFNGIMESSDFNRTLYKRNVQRRYIGFIKNQARGIWNKNNTDTLREKTKFLEESIQKSDIKQMIEKFDMSTMSSMEKLYVNLLKKDFLLIFHLYGIAYNFAKNIRNKIRK
ncbi:MAG: glycosyltransferase [bacterium]|nr:glycosyltransferase [bacterium]